jgi:hypothetical protein
MLKRSICKAVVAFASFTDRTLLSFRRNLSKVKSSQVTIQGLENISRDTRATVQLCVSLFKKYERFVEPKSEPFLDEHPTQQKGTKGPVHSAERRAHAHDIDTGEAPRCHRSG